MDLLSGLIGAIIGALVGSGLAAYSAYLRRLTEAIENLLAIVFSIGFALHWDSEGTYAGRPAVPFHDNYTKLWTNYRRLRALLLMPKARETLDEKWCEYMDMTYWGDLPQDMPSRFFQKGTHTDRPQAIDRSGEFIEYLLTMLENASIWQRGITGVASWREKVASRKKKKG